MKRQRQDNGLALSLAEKQTIAQYDIHRDKVVSIAVWMVGLELRKGSERMDYHDGHNVLQQLSHSQRSQGV